jgi:hypothetical protein
MLNSSPEYVSAHQRDLAAMKPDKGATEILAARRAERLRWITGALSTMIGLVTRAPKPRRSADADTARPVADSR